MYEVMSSMAFALFLASEALIQHYISVPIIAVYSTIAFLIALNSMFNFWLIVHVCGYAVFYKNMTSLEPLYVVSAILMPLFSVSVYVTVSIALHCSDTVVLHGLIWLLLLPLVIMVLTVSLALVTVAKFICRIYSAYRPLDRQYKLAVLEMVPLLCYPVLNLVTSVSLYVNKEKVVPKAVYYAVPLALNVLCELLFMSHIMVVIYISKKMRRKLKLVSIEAY